MNPVQTSEIRLIPTLHYYQSRLPKLYRERKLSMVCLLLSQAAIGVLAFLDGMSDIEGLTPYTAIVAGVSGALVAWQEFKQTSRKLNRYTQAILSVQNLLLWWDSLTPVDQVSQANIETLVNLGESIKVYEMLAWADANREIDEQIEAKQEDKAEAPVRREQAKPPAKAESDATDAGAGESDHPHTPRELNA
jgi:hypothetical protein